MYSRTAKIVTANRINRTITKYIIHAIIITNKKQIKKTYVAEFLSKFMTNEGGKLH